MITILLTRARYTVDDIATECHMLALQLVQVIEPVHSSCRPTGARCDCVLKSLVRLPIQSFVYAIVLFDCSIILLIHTWSVFLCSAFSRVTVCYCDSIVLGL